MMENLLKPDKDRREQEPPKEAPAKIKALSMAAQLAGLKFAYFDKIRERERKILPVQTPFVYANQ